MRPKLRSRMPSITGRHMLNSELRLVLITAYHCSGVILWNMPSRVMPALLTSTSTGPMSRATRARPGGASLVIRNVPLVDVDAGLGLEFGGRLVVAGIIRGDLVAAPLQGLGNRRADAARSAGDDCNPAMLSSLSDRFPRAFLDRRGRIYSLAGLAEAGAGRSRALALDASSQCPCRRRCTAWQGPFWRRGAASHAATSTSTRAPGGADRMADGDRAAVDVHDRRIPAHVLVDGERLRGESLVGLDEIEILDLPAGLFERLARRRDRARSHDRRIDAGGRPGDDAGERRRGRASWLPRRSSARRPRRRR